MFGPFSSSLTRMGGYLWKVAPRLSVPQKNRLRKRMRLVDANIDAIVEPLTQQSGKTGFSKLDYLKFQFPREHEMLPRDKYTTFDKKAKGYRKLLHRVPKWTKKSFRENPKYY